MRNDLLPPRRQEADRPHRARALPQASARQELTVQGLEVLALPVTRGQSGRRVPSPADGNERKQQAHKRLQQRTSHSVHGLGRTENTER
jgi:hypothetical protein